MPRPNYAIQAGTRIPPRQEAKTSADTSTQCAGCKQKSAEIDRLRRQLSKGQGDSGGADARPDGGAGTRPNKIGNVMMWAALGFCAACLMFAMAAIVRHG